jgi:hypothetical protein
LVPRRCGIHANDSIIRFIAGCFRFFTFTRCLDRHSLIRTVAALRHQTLQPQAAGGAKQVGTDLALFRGRDKDARPVAEPAAEQGWAVPNHRVVIEPSFRKGGPPRWRQRRGFLLRWAFLLVCVGDPMFKYLTLPNPILQKWRIWLKDQFIGDVPPEDAFCEFECDKTQCQFGHWETCKRRLDYLELGKAQSGDASPLKSK